MKKWMMLFLIMTYLLKPAFCQEEELTPEQIWDNYIYYLVDTLGKSFAAKDPTFVNSIFDKDAFCKRIVIEKEEEHIKAFNDGFMRGFRNRLDFGKIIVNSLEGNYYDFVNHYTSVEGTTHLIYRLMHADGAFNYHNFELEWRDSTLNFVDVYVYLSGENLSETFHLLYKNALREELEKKKNFFGKKEALSSTKKLQHIQQILSEGKPQEAMDLFLTIPEKFRKQKVYGIWKIKIANELENEIYLNAVTEYVERFPDDPSFYLMAYDKAVADENYDLAFKYIDKIDISIGLDPFLDFYRGNVYYFQGNMTKAKEKYELIDQDYDFGILDDMLFEVYFAMKDYQNVIMILDRYIANYEYTKNDIIELVGKNNPGIFSIPELKEWKEKE